MKIKQANNSGSNTDARLEPILRQFFEQFTAEECNREVWNLMIAYAGQPNNYLLDPLSRSNTAYFCSKISLLVAELDSIWKECCRAQRET